MSVALSASWRAVGFRQAQQRQAAIGVAGAQPIERALGSCQHSVECPRTDAVRPDVLFTRTLDRLGDVHTGICLESRGRRNGRNQRNCYSVVPLDVRPFGLPAIVTSSPFPYNRLATRLASSMVTASIRADRRWM